MEICNKLVRSKVPGLLEDQGYQLKGYKLEGEQYDLELYSLFWQSFNQSLNAKQKQMEVCFADMMEIIKTLMIKNKVNPSQLKTDESQPIKWYKNLLPYKQKLANARTDFLQKFDELLRTNTEAVKDQLGDLLISLKQLVEVNNLSFAKIEEIRRETFKKFGGFGEGFYLEGVSKVQEYSF